MDQYKKGAPVASHRMPDHDRPRRPVPAWVTAPPEGAAPPVADQDAVTPVPDTGLEARPTPAPPAPADAVVGSATAAPAPAADGVHEGLHEGLVVPDFPPQEDLLPPAPTSPAVQLASVDTAPVTPLAPEPVAEDPGPLAPPAHAAPTRPVVPGVGQPRFSVPGLEHVLVAGTDDEPSGPIGYRTPARFARQQAPRPVAEPTTTRSFDAVLAAPAPAAPSPAAPTPSSGIPATAGGAAPEPTTHPDAVADQPSARGAATDGGGSGLPAGRTRRGPLVGPTTGAVLSAVAALATLGLAAWWFTAPATVHGTGLALGAVALLLSVTVLRDRTVTWQRPVALLGAVLGAVGTIALLWAVASALLPLAGVTLPDLTGSGVTPTLAP